MSCLLAGALAFGGGWLKRGSYEHTQQLAARAEAEAEARKIEERRNALAQQEADNARKQAQAREARLRADAAGARSELDRLRDTLAGLPVGPAPDPGVALGAATGTAELFGACANSLVQLAEDADAQLAECHATVRGLQGWVRAATAD
jgi:small-conductance mechanosensitive channel